MTTARTILDLELCLDDSNHESQQNHSGLLLLFLGQLEDKAMDYGSDEINDE